MQDLISIVVPVYNGEHFLRENVESILNQTYRNLEIIYICDMCTDRTVSILQEYASYDPRMVIDVEEERHGADISRNIGKEMAHGEWLIFLDCDDLFEENLIEILYKNAVRTGADMSCCFWEQFRDVPTKKTMPVNEGLKLFCKTYPIIDVQKEKKNIFQLVFIPPWTKLLHKSVYQKEDVYFQAIPNCDDIYFSLVAAVEAKKIVYADRILVYYRDTNGRDTISANQTEGEKENYIWEAYDKVYQYICKRDDKDLLLKSFYHRICMSIQGHFGMGVFEKLYYKLRNIYFDKWKMWNIDVNMELSYLDREIYRKVQKGDLMLNVDDMVLAAKEQMVRDLSEKSRCSVWGCGYEGQRLLKKIENTDIEIEHVFDNNSSYWGKYIAGKLVERFDMDWVETIIVPSSKHYNEIKMQIGNRAGKVYDLEKEIELH
ncbi:MAG: glycosyltransferase [Ruminococcus flavefaciens]|nr:glycosyltransferase [Ruminococcus flavefaciens]